MNDLRVFASAPGRIDLPFPEMETLQDRQVWKDETSSWAGAM
jgi:hypothetical protein